jgi:hypothetical protein
VVYLSWQASQVCTGYFYWQFEWLRDLGNFLFRILSAAFSTRLPFATATPYCPTAYCCSTTSLPRRSSTYLSQCLIASLPCCSTWMPPCPNTLLLPHCLNVLLLTYRSTTLPHWLTVLLPQLALWVHCPLSQSFAVHCRIDMWTDGKQFIFYKRSFVHFLYVLS